MGYSMPKKSKQSSRRKRASTSASGRSVKTRQKVSTAKQHKMVVKLPRFLVDLMGPRSVAECINAWISDPGPHISERPETETQYLIEGATTPTRRVELSMSLQAAGALSQRCIEEGLSLTQGVAEAVRIVLGAAYWGEGTEIDPPPEVRQEPALEEGLASVPHSDDVPF